MSKELIRNLSLNFGTVTIFTFFFIPNIQMVIMCLCCVAFTVTNVCGYMHFMGLTIEIVTVINLILSVGLAIDYCAHIAVSYICYEEGTRHAKAKRALRDVGTAVFNGGFSTFLAFVMVAWSDSYAFTTFFKVILLVNYIIYKFALTCLLQMFSLVVLFGLYHGLIFLPVMLSIIGPQDPGAQDVESDEENEEVMVGHLNWGFSEDEHKNNGTQLKVL